MSTKSGIEWTDMTWNPVVGCTRVSAGCDNCYAIRQVHRMGHHPNAKVQAANAGLTRDKERGLDWSGEVRCLPERLELPLKIKKPARIFINSLADLFHEQVPDEFIDDVFGAMGACEDRGLTHVFQILTKRPARMLDYMNFRAHNAWNARRMDRSAFPPRNVWLGVSVENQQTADERIPLLLQTPAAVRFLSCEPLLSEINLTDWLYLCPACDGEGCENCHSGYVNQGIDWVIVGGESGPNARPMHPDWVRSIRDQCQAAGVPFFFKQWGEWSPHKLPNAADSIRLTGSGKDGSDLANCDGASEVWMHRIGKKGAGRLLDGREWNEMS